MYLTNFISFALISYCLTFFNKKEFRCLIKSDVFRAIITLVPSFFFFNQDNFYFNNFSYFLFFICILIIFINKEKISNVEYILYLFVCPVAILSKGIFIILFPFYLIAAIYHIYVKQFKSSVFYIPALIAFAISIIYYINSGVISNHNSNSLFEIALIALHSWVQIYAMYFNFSTPPRGASVFGTFVAVVMILFLFICLIKHTKKYFSYNNAISSDLIFIYAANLIAFAYIFATSTRHIAYSRLESLSIAFVHPPSSRVYFIAVVFIFISLCVYFEKFSYKKIRPIILFIFLIYSGYIFYPYIQYQENRNFMIEWSDTHQVMTKFDNYCIPTNPIRRVIRENCKSKYLSSPKSPSFVAEDYAIIDDQILSLLIEDNSNSIVYLVAYDKNQRKILRSDSIGHSEKRYKYFIFDQPLKFKKISFFNQDHQLLPVKLLQLHIYDKGNNSSGSVLGL